MKDLTQGSIRGHILKLATPIMIGMLVQTLYFLVDLYFVSQLGPEAVAGVAMAGNAVMLTIAITQMLSVGTVSLMSHAVGAKDPARANTVFNQSLCLSLLCSALTVALGLVGIDAYLGTVGAGPSVTEAGRAYLLWYLPGLALQYPLAAMSSALRATGIATPGMIVQMATVLLNIVLAPVLIAGWGTGHPLGVAGAGLASSIAVGVGVLLIAAYFWRLEKYVAIDRRALRPEPRVLAAMLRIGIPAGGEFVLLFVYTSLIYWIIRGFGPEAQAGFGIGMRVMQSMFMPALAISFAVPAVAGQNFGARLPARVRETMKQAVIIEVALMLLLVLASHVAPQWMIGAFTTDPQVLAVGVGFLTIVSLNFVAVGFGMACSGMFQAMGNTWPGLLSTASRLLTFVVPALLLMRRPGFALVHVWYLSVATMLVQAVVAGLLLRWQLRSRLGTLAAPQPAAAA